MRRAGLKVTESRISDHDDKDKMSEALTRLYRAASQSVARSSPISPPASAPNSRCFATDASI